jgi:hypothetical protein
VRIKIEELYEEGCYELDKKTHTRRMHYIASNSFFPTLEREVFLKLKYDCCLGK